MGLEQQAATSVDILEDYRTATGEVPSCSTVCVIVAGTPEDRQRLNGIEGKIQSLLDEALNRRSGSLVTVVLRSG